MTNDDRLAAYERYAIEAILDRPFADPDDNAAIAARAALRLAAGVGFPAEPTIGPIQHANSMCQKDGCTCWCQACERHNWRHGGRVAT
ncbi:MAG: hypothetical protein IMZ67_09190 [Acidobacteria bacterium]|nr:hypothetical protein [Acidobacteriota bacterium]